MVPHSKAGLHPSSSRKPPKGRTKHCCLLRDRKWQSKEKNNRVRVKGLLKQPCATRLTLEACWMKNRAGHRHFAAD